MNEQGDLLSIDPIRIMSLNACMPCVGEGLSGGATSADPPPGDPCTWRIARGDPYGGPRDAEQAAAGETTIPTRGCITESHMNTTTLFTARAAHAISTHLG